MVDTAQRRKNFDLHENEPKIAIFLNCVKLIFITSWAKGTPVDKNQLLSQKQSQRIVFLCVCLENFRDSSKGKEELNFLSGKRRTSRNILGPIYIHCKF